MKKTALAFTFVSLILITLIVAEISTFGIHLVVADSDNPISFSGGVCLYCPVNTTYNSKVLTLKLDFAAGMGLKHNLTYDVDGVYKGTIPLVLKKPEELHVVNPTTGTVMLPALSDGSHCLTIHVVCGLYGYLGANPPGAPFKQTAHSSNDWEATWTHIVFFSIDSNEPYQPQFFPSASPITSPSSTLEPTQSPAPEPQSEPFPTVPVVAFLASVIVVAVGLAICFRKRRGEAKPS